MGMEEEGGLYGNRVPEEIWGKLAEKSRGKIGPASNFAIEDLGTGRC
jgi:hypothetical protein